MFVATAGAVLAALILVLRTPVEEQAREEAVPLVGEAGVSGIISEKGIHWHPELTITIKGEKQLIPADIGMGKQFVDDPHYDEMMMMTDMHTHDASGTLHWEVMDGPVREDDVRLVEFFRVWDKKFSNSCIFEYCTGRGGQLRFIVNGKSNADFENYRIQDGDRIEIIYE